MFLFWSFQPCWLLVRVVLFSNVLCFVVTCFISIECRIINILEITKSSLVFFVGILIEYLKHQPFISINGLEVGTQLLSKMSVKVVAQFGERFSCSRLHNLCDKFQGLENDFVLWRVGGTSEADVFCTLEE